MVRYFGMGIMGDTNYNLFLRVPIHTKEGNNFCNL